jgi:hypothetical protein
MTTVTTATAIWMLALTISCAPSTARGETGVVDIRRRMPRSR